MSDDSRFFTRRDFIKTTGAAALGVATLGLPALGQDSTVATARSKVVLVRHPEVVGAEGKIDGTIISKMLDDAVAALLGKDDPLEGWKMILSPDDVVGIKTNIWKYLRTPPELEQAIKKRVMDAGVAEENVDIDDRGVMENPVFKRSTALINTRPMRTHAWAGVGSLIKNYIMFVPYPQNYHDNACAYLGAVWTLPSTKNKTRLNVLVMLTPQFHSAGPHHFDYEYIWNYGGLVVSADPVAADTVGLKIIQARRQAYFGEENGLKPSAHHIAIAETKYNLGVSDFSRIDLVRLGWQENSLI